MLVAQSLYNLKRYDEAIQTFREALAANLSTDMQAIAHVFLNYIYKERKQYDKAVQEDLEAIKAEPNNAGAFHSLGMAYYYMGEHTKAIDAFQKALWFNYSPPEQTYNWIGYIYIEQKMYDKALPFLNETFRNKPDYPNTSNNLGNAYFGLGRYADAAAAYQRAAKLDPNDAQDLYNLGFAYVKLGKKAEAMQVYNSLKKRDAKKAQDLLIEINKT
jgi:tetratricopeptide (TPR) repeat protein